MRKAARAVTDSKRDIQVFVVVALITALGLSLNRRVCVLLTDREPWGAGEWWVSDGWCY